MHRLISYKHLLAVLAVLVAISFLWLMAGRRPDVPEAAVSPVASVPAPTAPSVMVAAPTPAAAFLSPIVGGLSRVTKKSFGLYVTPKDSPVQPERFSGYHTGLDFETTPTEQGTDVVITAACDGTLLVKRTASGYGGVAVQSCQLNGQEVTVIYGHLQLASLTAKVGASLKAGDRLGVLGRGYSPETDGERQHLHFAIHVGNAVSLLGYVPTKAALAGWLDPAKLMSQ